MSHYSVFVFSILPEVVFDMAMSSDSVNKTLADWNKELRDILLPVTICESLYFLIGVLGNSTVLYIYLLKFKTFCDDRFFIPVLAVIDLIASVVTSSFSISINVLPVMYSSDIACKLLWYTGMTIIGASALTLMVIAINRYLKICKPFAKQIRRKVKKWLVVVIVIVPSLVSSPCFLFYGTVQIESKAYQVTGYRCSSLTAGVPKVALAFKSILFLIVLAIIIIVSVLYILIAKEIFKRSRIRKQMSLSKVQLTLVKSEECKSVFYDIDETEDIDSNSMEQSKDVKRDTDSEYKRAPNYSTLPSKSDSESRHCRVSGFQITIIFMIISAVFAVSFMPKLILMVVESIDVEFWTGLTPSQLAGFEFLYTLIIINNIINPFIYGLFDQKFRSELKNMWCCGKKE